MARHAPRAAAAAAIAAEGGEANLCAGTTAGTHRAQRRRSGRAAHAGGTWRADGGRAVGRCARRACDSWLDVEHGRRSRAGTGAGGAKIRGGSVPAFCWPMSMPMQLIVAVAPARRDEERGTDRQARRGVRGGQARVGARLRGLLAPCVKDSKRPSRRCASAVATTHPAAAAGRACQLLFCRRAQRMPRPRVPGVSNAGATAAKLARGAQAAPSPDKRAPHRTPRKHNIFTCAPSSANAGPAAARARRRRRRRRGRRRHPPRRRRRRLIHRMRQSRLRCPPTSRRLRCPLECSRTLSSSARPSRCRS